MIDININNYEEYIVDFFDGNLNSSEETALMVFLDKNPELKEEFDLFDNEKLLEEEIVFNDKGSLKKTSILHNNESMNFQELCIASIEGDLTKKENNLFNELLSSDSTKLIEFKKFENTKLAPDYNIIFTDKKALNKKTGLSWKKSYSAISIAASILLLVGLYFIVPRTTEKVELISAQNIEIENKKQVIDTEIEKDVKSQELNSIINIKSRKTEINTTLHKERVDIKDAIENKNEVIREKNQIAYLSRKEITIFKINLNKDVVFNQITFQNHISRVENKQQTSLRSLIANNFISKEKQGESYKLELFDIAKVSVEGINWLTGGNMKLERVYNEKGELNKTEFSSSLFAFSAPVKK